MYRKLFKAVILRHGESDWNHDNKFTGWNDVGLSVLGQQEIQLASSWIQDSQIRFDIAYTSILKRTIQTFDIFSEQTDHMHIPVIKSWRLNERHYG